MRSSATIAILLVLLILIAALSAGSARLDSATDDEPEHLSTGMIRLTAGRLDFYREQPPLMDSLFAAGLVLAGLRLPHWSMQSNPFALGRELLYHSVLDPHRLLFQVRLINIGLFLALCVTMFWFVGRETKSDGWALAALAFIGLCPNVMAHGRLVTVDVPATFFCFAAGALFLTLIEQPSLVRGALFGLAAAAAVMTKSSSNILGPWCAIVVVLAFMTKRIAEPKRFAKAAGVAILAAVVFAELFINLEASDAFIREAHPAMAKAPLLRVALPFLEYRENIRAIESWYVLGHTSPQFFFGNFSFTGWPEYYPVAFLLKATLPAILILIIAAVMAITRPQARSFAVIACALFALLFLIAAARGHLDLGIRYILPIFPFLYAGAIIALSKVLGPRSSVLGWVVAILLVWHAGENLFAYPSYISYFNELIGSRRNADKFLIDSNLDWGQDLGRLDLWCRDHKVEQISIHYFGGSDVVSDLRHVRPIIRSWPGRDPLPKGYFAVSRHIYRVSFFPRLWPDYETYLAASHARYITTVGGSIYVFRVE